MSESAESLGRPSGSGAGTRTLAVVVPCFNEVETVESCARSLLALELFDLVLLVDDGSTDGTTRVCRALERRFSPRLRAHRLTENLGKNLAIRRAVRDLDADVVVIYDADLTVPPGDLRPVAALAARHPQRFVFGSRFLRPMGAGAMPLLNRLGNRFFARWVSMLLRRRVTDVLCGVKAIGRRELLAIPTSRCRWGDFDLMFGAARRRLSFHEVPVSYRRRRGGRSKMKVFTAVLPFLVECLKFSLSGSAAPFSPRG